MSATARLDALGLLCPLPVIRTQERVKQLAPGCELEVLATDPGAVHDIRAWCRVHGHEYLDDRECRRGGCRDHEQPHFHIRLRVSD
ncbi:MAG TPA: sulfurtransferase TusA family protein [Pseudomonadales bacterium]